MTTQAGCTGLHRLYGAGRIEAKTARGHDEHDVAARKHSDELQKQRGVARGLGWGGVVGRPRYCGAGRFILSSPALCSVIDALQSECRVSAAEGVETKHADHAPTRGPLVRPREGRLIRFILTAEVHRSTRGRPRSRPGSTGTQRHVCVLMGGRHWRGGCIVSFVPTHRPSWVFCLGWRACGSAERRAERGRGRLEPC